MTDGGQIVHSRSALAYANRKPCTRGLHPPALQPSSFSSFPIARGGPEGAGLWPAGEIRPATGRPSAGRRPSAFGRRPKASRRPSAEGRRPPAENYRFPQKKGAVFCRSGENLFQKWPILIFFNRLRKMMLPFGSKSQVKVLEQEDDLAAALLHEKRHWWTDSAPEGQKSAKIRNFLRKVVRETGSRWHLSLTYARIRKRGILPGVGIRSHQMRT